MSARNLLTAVLIAGLAWMQTGCDGGRCVRGNRDVITEYRTAEAFSGTISEGSWDVFIHHDSLYYVIIEAESNILPYIVTETADDDMVLRTRRGRCINNREPIRIHVYTPDLRRVALMGSGDIDAEQLAGVHTELRISGSGDIQAGVLAENLKAVISGSGDLHLMGEVDVSEMEISGSGDIRAYDLVQRNCFATISGSGDMYLNVTDLLDVRITGSGDVYYTGNPQVRSYIPGSGSIHHVW